MHVPGTIFGCLLVWLWDVSVKFQPLTVNFNFSCKDRFLKISTVRLSCFTTVCKCICRMQFIILGVLWFQGSVTSFQMVLLNICIFCAILNDITCYMSYMYARSLSCILWFCSGLSKFLKLATTAWFIVYFILHEHNFESPLGVNHGNSFILLAVD